MPKWTEGELQIIRANCHKPLYEWRHLLPDRSDRAIALMAKQIGVVVTQKKQENEVEARFWKYTEQGDPSQCWKWIGATTKQGYGQLRVNGASILAHRFSWELHNGTIPSDESSHRICVLHTCNNKACVNPDHLLLGSQAEHMKQLHKEKKVKHGKGKLNHEQVREVKHLLREGKLHIREIAEKYEVSHNTVWFIKHGKSWAHVE